MAVSDLGDLLAVAHQAGNSIQFYIYARAANVTRTIHFEFLPTMDVKLKWNEADTEGYPPLGLLLTLDGKEEELMPDPDGNWRPKEKEAA